MYYFNLFPTFKNNKCNLKLVSKIPAYILAKIIRYNVEHVGVSTEYQRLLNPDDSRAYYNGMWGRNRDDNQTRRRNGVENVCEAKFEAGEGTVIVGIPSSLIDENKGMVTFELDGVKEEYGGCIMLPRTEEEMAMWAKEIKIMDGQTHSFAFDEKIFNTHDDVRKSVEYMCHIIVDPTPDVERKVFLRNNKYRKNVDNALLTSHNIDNMAATLDEDFASRVVRRLATDIFDLGGDFGYCYSDMHGNVNFGRKEGQFNLNKLIQALSHGPVSLYRAYGGNGETPLSEKAECAAARDVARVLRAWNLENASPDHGGCDTIFGKLNARTAPKANPIIKAAPVYQITSATRSKGLPNYNTHYILGTAAALLLHLGNDPKTIGNMRSVIKRLYKMREMNNLEEKKLHGQGGGDAFTKARKDSEQLLKYADFVAPIYCEDDEEVSACV